MTVRQRADEEGAATVWVLALASLLTAMGLAALVIGSGFAAHRRAAAAADLAALAGATRSLVDHRYACQAAGVVAASNGAQLLACELDGTTVSVVVGLEPRVTWLPGIRVAARAGPPP
jgi:secretion/DNA translocation related TadE-like protein